MQISLGGADVGPLRHQRSRQADRQVARQSEMLQVECLSDLVSRELTGERGQQVALDRDLLLQWRQRLLDLGQRGLLRQHVDLRGLTGLQLAVENAENVTLDLDDALGRCDLAAQRGLLDGGRDDVRRQRQIGRLELEARLLGLRLQAFDAARVLSPKVRHEADGQLRRVERVARLWRITRPLLPRHVRALLVRGRIVRAELRIEQPALCLRILVGDADRGVGGVESRVARD